MLIVLTSHPIQYQAPLWRALAAEGRQGTGDGGRERGMEVWFLTDQGVRRTEDRGFGESFAWDVDLLSGYSHRFLELEGEWDMSKFDGIRLAKSMECLLREAGATALWVEGWRFKVVWQAVRAAKKLGIPVFLRGETSDKIAERGGAFGLLRKWALRWLFARVDYFLAIGQASRRFYLKHGVPEEKLLDAPYCVDNEFFWREAERFRAGGTDGIRMEWNVPDGAKVVLFCGKFVPKKRPMDIVRAAVLQLKNGEQPWHLLFVGSGELGRELRSACDVRFDADVGGVGHEARGGGERGWKQNADAPSASFVGFLNQSEISKAYAVADVLVLPSEAWETWGLVVNEATAAGVPTVISDQCGCAEDFAKRNPYSGTYPMGDVEALRREGERLLSLKVDRTEIGRMMGYFSVQTTVDQVLRKLPKK